MRKPPRRRVLVDDKEIADREARLRELSVRRSRIAWGNGDPAVVAARDQLAASARSFRERAKS